MKALSLFQPWAQLVVEGHKEFETRSWRTNYQEWVAIHASKQLPRLGRRLLFEEENAFVEALNRPPEELHRGAIIGIVFLRECRRVELTLQDHSISDREKEFGDWSDGRYAWWLGSPQVFANPIPVKGALGLWTVPEDVEREVCQHLGIPWRGDAKPG